MKGNKTNEVTVTKKRRGTKKQRGVQCYENKCRKIEGWYNHIVKNRQETFKRKDVVVTKKPLQPLEFFIDKVKKPGDK